MNDVEDRLRHRRGKQRRHTFGWDMPEDVLHVLLKAHLQHLVGFVQDEHRDLAQVNRAALQVIHQAPWRRDDRVYAAAECASVGVRSPAHHRSAAGAHDGACRDRYVLRDLHGELARRREHDRLRRILLWIDALDERYAERSRLAGAGQRLRDNVASREQHRNSDEPVQASVPRTRVPSTREQRRH